LEAVLNLIYVSLSSCCPQTNW